MLPLAVNSCEKIVFTLRGNAGYGYLKTGSSGEYLGTRCMRMLSGDGSRIKKLDSLYRSPDIFRMIKYRRLRWADHFARMEYGRRAIKILTGKPT